MAFPFQSLILTLSTMLIIAIIPTIKIALTLQNRFISVDFVAVALLWILFL